MCPLDNADEIRGALFPSGRPECKGFAVGEGASEVCVSFPVSCWACTALSRFSCLSSCLVGRWIMALDGLICVISRQNMSPLCCQENVLFCFWIWRKWMMMLWVCVCVCARARACACVCWYPRIYVERSRWALNLGILSASFFKSPLRNYSPHLTKIVCKALCLWHDYWFFWGNTT